MTSKKADGGTKKCRNYGAIEIFQQSLQNSLNASN